MEEIKTNIVKSFIQVSHLSYRDRNIYEQYNNIDKFDYTQKFIPELIIKHFYNWEYRATPNNPLCYQVKNDKFLINCFYDQYILFVPLTYDDTAKEDWLFNNNKTKLPYPRTIDDFMNFCQLVGIELRWRNE